MVQNIHILTLNSKRAKQWRLVTKIFGGAANVLPYQFAPQIPLAKATPTL